MRGSSHVTTMLDLVTVMCGHVIIMWEHGTISCEEYARVCVCVCIVFITQGEETTWLTVRI